MLFSDPKTLLLVIISGIAPAFLWLVFWLREDKDNPEPKGLLAIVFIMGVASVWLVLPIQQMIQKLGFPSMWELTAWAGAEEIVKFVTVWLIVSNTEQADEPTDWPIYLITVALGFAALENILFLIKPFSVGETAVALLTGQLRFLGSTLLHTVTSGAIGISMGLSFYMSGFKQTIYVTVGVAVAIILHSVFNFFIIQSEGGEILKALSFLWVSTIIVFLLFEKLRRMNLSTNK